MGDLEETIKAWEYIAGHNDGKLSKGMSELVLKTLKLLYGLRETPPKQ